MQMQQEEESQATEAVDKVVDYQPLIEALNNWQAIFELALDEVTLYLSPEQFPAQELSASLVEMCDLLRGVLAKNSALPAARH
jgi:hypothetical protein